MSCDNHTLGDVMTTTRALPGPVNRLFVHIEIICIEIVEWDCQLLMGGLGVCTKAEGRVDMDGGCWSLRTFGFKSSSFTSCGVTTTMLGCVAEPS